MAMDAWLVRLGVDGGRGRRTELAGGRGFCYRPQRGDCAAVHGGRLRRGQLLAILLPAMAGAFPSRRWLVSFDAIDARGISTRRRGGWELEPVQAGDFEPVVDGGVPMPPTPG